MTITATALHALFEPIRAKGWDGWPTGLELHANITCHQGCGGAIACGFPDALTADLLLAASLRWLAERGDGYDAQLISPHGKGLHWGIEWRMNDQNTRWIHTGPTPYHAAAAALRAAMGMEATK